MTPAEPFKYAVHPVGQVTFTELCRCYGLDPRDRDVIRWDDGDDSTWRGRRHEDYVHLGFRPDGDYAAERERQEVAWKQPPPPEPEPPADKPPIRYCNRNIAIKDYEDNVGCRELATHIITGPDGKLQWFGCDVHAAEARELGCTTEDWEEWYRRNILGEPMDWEDYLKTLG